MIYDEAIRLVECGLSVIPIKGDGSKSPALASWKTYQEARANKAEIRAWFAAVTRKCGIAVINGAVSGNLETLDFDEVGLFDEFFKVCAAHGLSEIIDSLPVVKTPSGGSHLYWRSESPPPGNQKLAYTKDRKVRIETRGEGGYALIPPSPAYCHEANKPYIYSQGHLATVPVINEGHRNALVAIAQTFNEYLEPERIHSEPKPIRDSGGVRPGDDFNRIGNLPELLQKHGWAIAGGRGERTLWRRPGKRFGISATENYAGSGYFYVFTGNAAPLEADRAYSHFAVYAILEHGGDFSAAARQLAHEGFGERPPRPIGTLPKPAKLQPGESDSPIEAQAVTIEGGKNGPTQLALATAWADIVRDEFVYVEGDQWWAYNKGIWGYSSVEVVQASIQAFLTRLHEEDVKIGVTRGAIMGVLFLAKSLLGPRPLSDFDAHPEWIPLQNGVYDTRTGALMPHCPEYHLTHQSPLCYDVKATCPRWEQFLSETMLTTEKAKNAAWIEILQEWFGYCLIPDTTAQSAMFWVGEGGNGKGVATRVLENLVGTEYCTAIPIEQLHDPYYRADLHNKLLGLVNEPDPRAMQKNGTFFKALTGGDRIDARRPTEKVFKFKPTCRIIVSCNDLPSTRDVSRGYFRRIILIEWRFNVPDGQKDPALDDKLAAELPGIFNWAMQGLERWRARGRRFVISEESQQLLADYKLSEDTLARYLTEECSDDKDGWIGNSAFYAGYSNWSKNSGEHPHTAANIGRQLAKRGYKPLVRRIGPSTVRGWQGLSINSASGEDR